MASNRIPVRNLYVLLAFASRDQGLLSDRDIDSCDFDCPLDLLARLLDASLRRIRLRGVDREYVTHAEQGVAPRGSLDIGRTVSQLLLVRGELAWNADDLDSDTACNRLVKAALRALLSAREVEASVRQRLRAHVGWLSGVQELPYVEALRLRPRSPRGIPEYRNAVRLALLALESALPDEAMAGRRWRSVADDPERMGALFESFVRGFLAYHLAGRARVSSRWLKWNAEFVSGVGSKLLPGMRTDVYVDWQDQPPTVCECKFYQHPLLDGQWGGDARVRSDHLYQLMAYLRATEREVGEFPSGLLLYAKAGEALDEHWVLDGFDVRVKTVDLSLEWGGIRERMVGVCD